MDEDKGAWAEVAEDGIVPTEKDTADVTGRSPATTHPPPRTAST